MRESFQRLDNGTTILIEVDLEADSYKKGFVWLFSVFVKFDLLNKEQSSYEEFLEMKESLIIALEYDDNVKYVGSRGMDGWSEFYFYSSASKELNSMASAILQESQYVHESNVVRDTKWDFYEKQLLPTKEEYYHIQSAKIITLLEEEGDNIEENRVVEYYVAFDTKTQKERFIETFSIEDFTFKDEISSDEFEHGVALESEHCVTEQKMKEMVEKLLDGIKKEHGYYEGWSTTLVL